MLPASWSSLCQVVGSWTAAESPLYRFIVKAASYWTGFAFIG